MNVQFVLYVKRILNRKLDFFFIIWMYRATKRCVGLLWGSVRSWGDFGHWAGEGPVRLGAAGLRGAAARGRCEPASCRGRGRRGCGGAAAPALPLLSLPFLSPPFSSFPSPPFPFPCGGARWGERGAPGGFPAAGAASPETGPFWGLLPETLCLSPFWGWKLIFNASAAHKSFCSTSSVVSKHRNHFTL